jgi:hypothetical protein
MYQFEHEVQRKEKVYKVYVILFIVSAMINAILFFLDGSHIRGIISLLFSFIVFYYSLRKHIWAILIIKCMVWLHS